MESPHSTTNAKEFEVTGVSRSGRVRKKSSKLLDFQSPDEVERKIFKRGTAITHLGKSTPVRYTGRGRPSLAALKARRTAQLGADEKNVTTVHDEVVGEELEDKHEMDVDSPKETDEEEEEEEIEEEEDVNDTMLNSSGLTAGSDSDDDGFGELVADFVGSEGTTLDSKTTNQKSHFRQSLYISENKKVKESRLERKDKGKARYTAYNMWAREHRKSLQFGKNADMDHHAARRLHELWSNVSNKEKSAWKRKAKMQATRAKQRERSGINQERNTVSGQANQTTLNTTFINRPTTSRTRKLAEDKQKAKIELSSVKPSTPTTSISKRTRYNSFKRNYTNPSSSNNPVSSPIYATTNGSNSNHKNTTNSVAVNNTKTLLPAIEPIDVAAHLKLLGESLSIIGDRLKEHDGQIAVSGSLSVLLDSLLCSLGPLLCLTTRLPGLDKKPQLKINLATTLDNIAYVMPGL